MQKNTVLRLLVGALLLTPLIWGALPAFGAKNQGALMIELRGTIGPAAARHVESVIQRAYRDKNEVVVIQIDTLGGLPNSMRKIVDAITASPVPVVAYVSPEKTRATGAGAYIVYASNIAAMAPDTFIGPMTLNFIGQQLAPVASDGDQIIRHDSSTGEAVALIRSLSVLRGRNAEWAEKSARQLAALTAAKAVELKVVDLMAPDVRTLLDSIDGRGVKINNVDVVLHTKNISVRSVGQDMFTQIIAVMADPNVALVLFLAGIYLLVYELAVPGIAFPGVFGAISLVVGLYMLNQLPVEPAGLGLILLGMAFMIAEAFTPSFGVLGVGGSVAFVIGGALLIDSDIPAYQLSWGVIFSSAVVSAALLAIMLGYFWRSYRVKIQSGIENLIGSKAVVVDWSGEEGHVWVHGERWNARGDRAYATGDKLTIHQVDGLTLIVAGEAFPET